MTDEFASIRRVSGKAVIASLLLVFAAIFGGGGSPNSAAEFWLQTLAALMALAWLWTGPRDAALLKIDRRMLLVALLVVALPTLQLVPLPSAFWSNLPGRETQIAALELVNEQNSWWPISMSSPRTLASLLALGPPLLVLMMTSALPPLQRRWLIASVGLMAVLSACFGVLQVAAGQAALRFYAETHVFGITGFHANRNAAADVLLIGIVALGVIAAPSGGGQHNSKGQTHLRRLFNGWWLGGACLFLCLAAVLTGSRMGIALLPVALIGLWLLMRGHGYFRLGKKLPAFVAVCLALAGGAVFVLRDNKLLNAVAARFDVTRDARLDIWADSWFAVGKYWPWGSGMGTFVPSFAAVERLEAVDPTLTNRAHNDYLELLLEAGAVGIVLLIVIAALLLVAGWRAWRTRPHDRAQLIFAITTLAVVGMHSVVDYPLRSMALACFTAMAAGLLAQPPKQSSEGIKSSPAAL